MRTLAMSWSVALIMMLGALTGCQTGVWSGFPPPQTDLVWPPPPDAPRVHFVMSIRNHQDLFAEGGGFRTLRRWLVGPSDSTMVRPFAVALHPSGGLLVADPGRRCVHFYQWSTRTWRALGAEREGGLPSPVGVAALPDGRILVSDSRLESILVYDGEGASLGEFTAEGTVSRPAGLAVDPVSGEVYVADVTKHQVAVFDSEGQLLRRIGTHGIAPGQFNFPTHVAYDQGTGLAVADSMNFRVQIFGESGGEILSIGEAGDVPGAFSRPKGVAFGADDTILVVEGLHDAIQFFNRSGEFLMSLGNAGNGPGEFWLAAGLCFDPTRGLMFVADSYNARVQVFQFTEAAIP